MKNNLAPIVIFTYKRLDTLMQSINALKQCDLSSDSHLLIYSDFYKSDDDKEAVLRVRDYLKKINGFKTIEIICSKYNKGLASSVIFGVSDTISRYNKVIVLEDDLIPSKNFLVYMNKALNHYYVNKKVFSISGYTIPVNIPKDYLSDIYFLPRISSWGWATWRDRWEKADWEINEFKKFSSDKSYVSRFNSGGSDLFEMLEKQITGKIDSWAIRWCYSQFINNGLTVYPCVSKIKNIGFGKDATNSNVYNRYKTTIDNSSNHDFKFNDIVSINQNLLLQFQSFFSLRTRFVGKVKTYLYKTKFLKNT